MIKKSKILNNYSQEILFISKILGILLFIVILYWKIELRINNLEKQLAYFDEKLKYIDDNHKYWLKEVSINYGRIKNE